MSDINIKNLHKTYSSNGKDFVIAGLNLQISKNGIYIIRGKNGCGKSTLLNIISSIDRQYDGQVNIFNYELKTCTNKVLCLLRSKYISYLPQQLCLIEDLTIIQNLLLVTDDINKILSEIYRYNLESLKDHKVENLSGGQKQKVAIIRAFLKESKLILLDEPNASLDKESNSILIEDIKENSKQKIVIVISHSDFNFTDLQSEIIDLDKEVSLNG